MERRTPGLPKLSHTKLIFTRRDLGTLGDLPGKETYVNMLHNATVMRKGSWTAPYCARLEQMYMVPCSPCIGRLAAAPDLKGLSMMIFHMLSSWTSVCSVYDYPVPPLQEVMAMMPWMVFLKGILEGKLTCFFLLLKNNTEVYFIILFS